ncbi:erythromycin esterase family protein [Alkaliphilus oremlandii]|uniref:Erythromycin esterase n=1 Tax=Alkaliphilus oremlandii (strain OhILAs) TaxID=350688 RepID=A8MGC9_ALKOO|nr:erythromycin esterase family protein [Alkaliphilus oremlandii]ABW18857.1 Erythromycin esterase [Alkaliphilus oremlandii OhILAs]
MGSKNIKDVLLGGLVKRKKFSSLRFIVLFFVGITIMNFGVLEINADTYENLDLKNNIISLETTKAGNGFEDLEPLKEMLKDKKIVAMGEATHGTKEFFEIKHRMFEFLVEEMGYRAFAIEAEFGEVQMVNEYILSGTGSAYDAVRALTYSVWHTEEVLQMVEWMYKYNMNPSNKEKIRFYGFDMKPVKNDVDAVLFYLERVDKEIYSKYASNLALIRRNDNVSLDIVRELKTIFDENKGTYIVKTSDIEYEMIYQHLEIINQWAEFKEVTDILDAVNKRDKYMAENVKWIYDYEKNFNNDKIMLWAHNGHVSKKFINYKSMGEHLKEIYGDMLYVIGFDFYKGSFNSNPGNIIGNFIGNKMASFTIKEGYSGSFAAVFEKTGIPLSFMDFRLASKNPEIADWLSQEQYIRSIGAIYVNEHISSFAPEIPIESYDGLIFVSETTASERMNKDEKIITNGNRYLIIYYVTRIFILVLIIFCIVKFIRKRKRKSIKQQ